MSGSSSKPGGSSHKASLSTSSTSSGSSSVFAGGARAPLLDDDGDLTPKFHRALAFIFQKYASVPSEPGSTINSAGSSSTNMDPFLARTFAEEKARHTKVNLREDSEGEAAAAAEDAAEAAVRAREDEEAERAAMRSSLGSTSRAVSAAATHAGAGDGAADAEGEDEALRPSTPTQQTASAQQGAAWSLTAPTPVRPSHATLGGLNSSGAAIALGSEPPVGAVLSDAALDRFAFETNGAPFGAESKAEILEFLDVDEEGRLTFEGFISMYSLQTENDEDETWRDLATHGFDANLELVSTRREESGVDEGRPVPKNRLLGTGMGGPRDETRPETPVSGMHSPA